MNIDKKLKVWSLLKIGDRVESKTYKKGERGTVWEKLGCADELMNGLRRYGIKMDRCGNVADFSRYELKKIKKNMAHTP